MNRDKRDAFLTDLYELLKNHDLLQSVVIDKLLKRIIKLEKENHELEMKFTEVFSRLVPLEEVARQIAVNEIIERMEL